MLTHGHQMRTGLERVSADQTNNPFNGDTLRFKLPRTAGLVDNMWTCPHCNGKTDDEFQICWTCRIPRGGSAADHELKQSAPVRRGSLPVSPEGSGTNVGIKCDAALVQTRVICMLQGFTAVAMSAASVWFFTSSQVQLKAFTTFFSPASLGWNQFAPFVWWSMFSLVSLSLLSLGAAVCMYHQRGCWFCILVFAMQSLLWPIGTFLALVSFAVALQPGVIDSFWRAGGERM